VVQKEADMTFRTIYECDICGKQEDARYVGISAALNEDCLPDGWFIVRDSLDKHFCSKECGKKFFEGIK
jgi:hypothetical protein